MDQTVLSLMIHQCTLQEGATYDEVLGEFMTFLSQVYGYDIAEELSKAD